MDEAAYRQALITSIAHACPFEKSILTHCAACSLAEKRHIAEREAVICNDAEALVRCIALRDALRHNFNFALGRPHIDGPLPHAQEMRMQCGGLRGLQFSLDGVGEVRNVAALLKLAQQQYGELADYPYSKIVQLANDCYRPRKTL
ncbi:MAG: hypothetical protein HY016_00635 [Nitrosomonadales bacterium]|nr:hypothetical protein [Nitrosomonadales bacterium]